MKILVFPYLNFTRCFNDTFDGLEIDILKINLKQIDVEYEFECIKDRNKVKEYINYKNTTLIGGIPLNYNFNLYYDIIPIVSENFYLISINNNGLFYLQKNSLFIWIIFFVVIIINSIVIYYFEIKINNISGLKNNKNYWDSLYYSFLILFNLEYNIKINKFSLILSNISKIIFFILSIFYFCNIFYYINLIINPKINKLFYNYEFYTKEINFYNTQLINEKFNFVNITNFENNLKLFKYSNLFISKNELFKNKGYCKANFLIHKISNVYFGLLLPKNNKLFKKLNLQISNFKINNFTEFNNLLVKYNLIYSKKYNNQCLIKDNKINYNNRHISYNLNTIPFSLFYGEILILALVFFIIFILKILFKKFENKELAINNYFKKFDINNKEWVIQTKINKYFSKNNYYLEKIYDLFEENIKYRLFNKKTK